MALNDGLTGIERVLDPDAIVVSKTDVRGCFTYANQAFLDIAGYTETQVLGHSHNIVRHPDMPKTVFRLLWETIQDGREIFAYVINRARNGDHYWVFAHVTPTFDAAGSIVGFHSSRRAPRREAVEIVMSVYRDLRAEEQKHARPEDAIAAGKRLLTEKFIRPGEIYEDLVFSL